MSSTSSLSGSRQFDGYTSEERSDHGLEHPRPPGSGRLSRTHESMDALDEMMGRAAAAPAPTTGHWPPKPQKQTGFIVPVPREKGAASWSWCRPQPPKTPSLKPPPDVAADRFQLARVLSSPTTLTDEGRDCAVRVLGVSPESVMVAARARKMSEPRLTPLDPKSVPQTCNQMYGARAHEAQRPDQYLPKNTCDVGRFADAANKSKTPYCPHIRL
mmetsp:Transcript_5709/g.16171  ORF Transcript_5709/g.16171 Transcript_5709/m.16171 type:complete len:215 (-) Transcript_5709:77-721(-)